MPLNDMTALAGLEFRAGLRPAERLLVLGAFDEAIRVLSSRGRYVVVGFASGRIPSLSVNRLLLRNTDVRGCTWSVLAEAPGGFAGAGARLAQRVENEGMRPTVGARHCFEDLEQGLRSLSQREASGKQVLVVGGGGGG